VREHHDGHSVAREPQDDHSVEDEHHEGLPRIRLTRGRVLGTVVFVAAALTFLYFGLPKLVGLGRTVRQLEHGNFWWLAVAFVLETLSFLGYVVLFRAVFVSSDPGSEVSPVTWRVSYQITMAGLAATRVLAAAGAGGIALTAWSLRRSGMASAVVARRMVAFMALLYGVYMLALVVDGLGLYLGLWPGAAPFAITVVPAIFGAVVIGLFLAISLLPGDVDRLVRRWHSAGGWTAAVARRLAAVPAATAAGVQSGLALLRRREPGLLGAFGWWGFDVATLWACFHAFGASPTTGVVVMAYFVGWLANTLPLPGGIGGVEGGMIGAFSAFGVNVQTAVVAVLAYRAFSFWLPTLPGGVAYFQLRRTVTRWRRETAAPADHRYTY